MLTTPPVFRMILFAWAIMLQSCAEFVEYPLENERITLLSPSDGFVSEDSIVSFWWSKHEDAKFYRFQVASPDFVATDRLIVDSLVNDDKIEFGLDTGTYAWRIRPENHGSVGAYTERRLKVVAP